MCFHDLIEVSSVKKELLPFVKDKNLSSRQLYPKLKSSTLMGNSPKAYSAQLNCILLTTLHESLAFNHFTPLEITRVGNLHPAQSNYQGAVKAPKYQHSQIDYTKALRRENLNRFKMEQTHTNDCCSCFLWLRKYNTEKLPNQWFIVYFRKLYFFFIMKCECIIMV